MAKKRPNPGQPTFESLRSTAKTTEVSYAGDQPNPHLRSFVEANSTPYDPATDAYDVPAFNQTEEGVHYSDLFEQYLPIADKPRRLLADWLPEYFFKTTTGTWRPPDDDKEREQKAALRQTGTLRRIKRFANALIEGVPVRDKDRAGNDHTLADWIRQCRRAGLFEQGRALYEKGGLNLDHLNETEQIEVEDDYRSCVRRGGAAEAKPKRQRRKTGDI